jgi:hypothetical protein
MATTAWSITQSGRYEPFELQVARGQISWHIPITVFGYNPDVDTTEETIWPGGGIITQPSAALQWKVSSASVNDASAGTGARTVFIDGLDANYNKATETVTLNGQTAVLTSNSYLRINSAYVATAGSSNGAEGNIYFGTGTVTAGVPATVWQIILFDYNATTTGHYTVPAGYTAYMDAGQISAGQPTGSSQVTGRLLASGVNNIRRTAALVALNNGTATYDFFIPISFPEKTDIEAAAVGSAANNAVSSYFNILLIKNDAA